MKEAIIAAIIGAVGVVLAAIIGLLKRESGNKTVIKQRSKGDHTTQIGVQISKDNEEKNNEHR